MDYISFSIDTPQNRLARDRVGTMASGVDWYNAKYWENIYVEPVHKTVMLLPAPRSVSWSTSGSGNNARYRKSDYTLTSASWLETAVSFTSDYWIKSTHNDLENEAVITNASQPTNGGMYLAWYAANSSAEDWIQMECGYGADPDDAESHAVSLRVWSSGKVDVYRFGGYVDTVTISGSETPQQTASTFTDLLIIPLRKKEVLILSNRGSGGTVIFDDIPEDEDDAEITPSVPFWWKVPTGLAHVQCAPIRYPSSGYIAAQTSYFSIPPKTGLTVSSLLAHDANGGTAGALLVEENDPTTTFVPNDIKDKAHIRVNLSGSGFSSPNVYSAYVYFNGEIGQTPDAETALDDYITQMSLNVSDSPSDVSVSIVTHSPQAIIDMGVANYLNVSNRPFALKLGSALITAGATESPKYRLANSDMGTRVSIDCRDHWKAFENYTFADNIPLDGMNLSEAFLFLVKTVGFSDFEIDIEDTEFYLPSSVTPSDGNWSVEIQAGDSVAEWLNRLHEDYCSTYFMGWVPTTSGLIFKLVSPGEMSLTPVWTLYQTDQDAWDAILLEGHTEAEARQLLTQYTYRSYDQDSLEPEANVVWVTGFDPRTRKSIQVFKQNTSSQTVTTPVHLRDQDWLGCIRRFGYVDSTITTVEHATRCCELISLRLFHRRFIAEFETDLIIKEDGIPAWRGDVIHLDGLGDFRIKAFQAVMEVEPKDHDFRWRPTRYTCEFINEVDYGVSQIYGRNLSEIKAAHKLRAVSKTKIQPNSDAVIGMLPLEIVRL